MSGIMRPAGQQTVHTLLHGLAGRVFLHHLNFAAQARKGCIVVLAEDASAQKFIKKLHQGAWLAGSRWLGTHTQIVMKKLWTICVCIPSQSEPARHDLLTNQCQC